MISLEEFRKNRDSRLACDGCEIYRTCLTLRKKFKLENDYEKDFQKFIYKKFINIWRKEKLEKLLS